MGLLHGNPCDLTREVASVIQPRYSLYDHRLEISVNRNNRLFQEEGIPTSPCQLAPHDQMHDSNIPAASGEVSELRRGWVPQHPAVVSHWLSRKVKQADAENKPFSEVIRRFQTFIESDRSIFSLFQQMFNQVPTTPPYNNDTRGNQSVSTYKFITSRWILAYFKCLRSVTT